MCSIEIEPGAFLLQSGKIANCEVRSTKQIIRKSQIAISFLHSIHLHFIVLQYEQDRYHCRRRTRGINCLLWIGQKNILA